MPQVFADSVATSQSQKVTLSVLLPFEFRMGKSVALGGEGLSELGCGQNFFFFDFE